MYVILSVRWKETRISSTMSCLSGPFDYFWLDVFVEGQDSLLTICFLDQEFQDQYKLISFPVRNRLFENCAGPIAARLQKVHIN